MADRAETRDRTEGYFPTLRRLHYITHFLRRVDRDFAKFPLGILLNAIHPVRSFRKITVQHKPMIQMLDGILMVPFRAFAQWQGCQVCRNEAWRDVVSIALKTFGESLTACDN